MGIWGLFKPNIEKLEARKDLQELIKALRYKYDENVRIKAAHALKEIGGIRAIEPLIAVLKDESMEPFVARLLREILEVTSAIEPFIIALRVPDLQIKIAWILGMTGDTRAIEPLAGVLKGSYQKGRAMAAWALGEIKDARVIDPLINALKDPDPGVRLEAVEALEKRMNVRAVEPLIVALEDKDQRVRNAVASALLLIGCEKGAEAARQAIKKGEAKLKRGYSDADFG